MPRITMPCPWPRPDGTRCNATMLHSRVRAEPDEPTGHTYYTHCYICQRCKARSPAARSHTEAEKLARGALRMKGEA